MTHFICLFESYSILNFSVHGICFHLSVFCQRLIRRIYSQFLHLRTFIQKINICIKSFSLEFIRKYFICSLVHISTNKFCFLFYYLFDINSILVISRKLFHFVFLGRNIGFHYRSSNGTPVHERTKISSP